MNTHVDITRPGDMPELSQGLSSAEAARQLAADALPGGKGRSLFTIVRETLREPMLLLLAAGVLYLAFGDLQEGLVLFGFVAATLGLTLYQEGKTEKVIEALGYLTSPRALVLRDGRQQRIAGRDVVQVDESLITGEAVVVDKIAAVGEVAPARPCGDNQPHVDSGSLVVLAVFTLAQQYLSEEVARAFAFVTLVTGNLALIFSNRTRAHSWLAAWRTPNPVLWAITGLTSVILLLTLYVPALGALLRFAPLSLSALGMALALGLASVVWFELVRKVVSARGHSPRR